ncbi:MAG: hypothetical protein AAF404_11540 [Pseudomonadota bacterium]
MGKWVGLMFLALAGYSARGPVQGAIVASSALVLSTILAPLVVVSSAIVALIWMRLGATSGLITVGVSLLFSTTIALMTSLPVLAPVAVMVSSWLPVIVMAWVLRDTVRLDMAILAGAVLVATVLVAVYAAIPDVAGSWRRLFSSVFENPQLLPGQLQEMDPQLRERMLTTASRYITGLYGAMWFFLAALSLLLARSWQAHLFNPGGLQKEFHELRFGRVASAASLIIAGAAVVTRFELLMAIAMLAVAVFALQGIAVLHGVVRRRGLGAAWLVAAYVLILLTMPESLIALAFCGATDAWFDFRKRAGEVPVDNDQQ